MKKPATKAGRQITEGWDAREVRAFARYYKERLFDEVCMGRIKELYKTRVRPLRAVPLLSWTLLAIFFLILVNAHFRGCNFADGNLLNGLIGTFIGALAVAIVTLGFQKRLEQTRYFAVITQKIEAIFSLPLCWRMVKDRGTNRPLLQPLEFRSAVGMAKWTADPKRKDGKGHSECHYPKENDPPIDWGGVAYKVDDEFIVASKALQNYRNWIILVIDAYKGGLLTKTQIQ